MKKFVYIAIFLYLCTDTIVFGQVSATVTNESLVTKSADAKADAENAWVSVVPGANKSFVDKSGRVVSGGGLNWSISPGENTPGGATFRAPMPYNSQNKTYTSQFRGTFAGSGTGNPVNWNVKSIISVKDAKLEVSTVSFANDFSICQDDGTSIIRPQWQKGLFAEATSNPVCYVRNNSMNVTAKFRVDNPTYIGNNKVWIRGKCSRGTNFPETQASVGGGYAEATANCGTIVNMVDYDKNMKFEWEYKIRQGDTWRSCGASEHELFVTLDTPQNGFKARSVFYLACKQTGATTQVSAINNLWNSFSGRNTKIWNEGTKSYARTIYYYRTSSGADKYTAAAMFANYGDHQGQCAAWMDLLCETMRVHGIPCGRVWLEGPYPEFVVKNATIISANSISTLPAGIPGQNMATPQAKRFGRHYITGVSYNGGYVFFDPSYGVYKYDILSYSQSAVAAWRHATAGWFTNSSIALNWRWF